MITYKLRLENSPRSPGVGWEAIAKSTGAWVCELNSQCNDIYGEIHAALISCKEQSSGQGNLVLFVNLWEDDMKTPLKFGCDLLNMLCKYNCSIELWR